MQIVVDNGGVAEISDTDIDYNCVISCKKELTIKRNCKIAEMVVIRDQDHCFGQPGLTLAEQGFDTAAINIGENVWLASKVTVLKGVKIGNNAVIGASSVVRNTVEPNSVYVGIPARRVK
jgi:acetyltransferase-like isoleucine patch superfamily enzyme